MLLWGVTLVTFTLTNLVPADPVQAALGERAAADPEIVERFRAEMGYDQPIVMQYVNYLGRLSRGDPVAEGLSNAFPATAELALTAMCFAIVMGLFLGAWAAVKRNKIEDQIIRALSLVGLSVPTFWLALVAFYLFFYRLRLVPGSGRLDPAISPPPRVTGMLIVGCSSSTGSWLDA